MKALVFIMGSHNLTSLAFMHPQGIFGLGNKKEEKGQWPNRWAL